MSPEDFKKHQLERDIMKKTILDSFRNILTYQLTLDEMEEVTEKLNNYVRSYGEYIRDER